MCDPKFIYGEDAKVSRWVGDQIGVKFPDDAVAIGIERAGEIVVGVVYDRFTGNDICMHVAAKPGVLWVRPEAMRRFFWYPFMQLECTRVTGLVAANNHAARKFDERIGFVQEGVQRQGMPDGTDLIAYGMLRSECRWIKNV